jgi:hypothetical protein
MVCGHLFMAEPTSFFRVSLQVDPDIRMIASPESGTCTRPGKHTKTIGKPWENHGKMVMYMENHHFCMGKSTMGQCP